MEHSSRLLWITAVFFGWYAVIAHGLAWYARRTLRDLLQEPLSDEVEAMTRFWDQYLTRWTATGLLTSVLSILSFGFWLIV